MSSSLNQSVNGRKNYGWEFLKAPEILDCMNELGIPMTPNDLEKPSPGKMQLVYSAFLELVMGVTKHYFDCAIDACSTEMVHFDIYEDSLLLMVFFRHLQVLMREVDFPNFSLQDLAKPDAYRVQCILSAIINLVRFQGEQQDVQKEFEARFLDCQEKRDNLLTENERLAQQIEELRERSARERPSLERVAEENEALITNLRELKKKESELAVKVDKVRGEKETLKERLYNSENLNQQTARELHNIQSKIVVSPERLTQQIKEFSESLARQKQFCGEQHRRLLELDARLETIPKVKADIQSCITLMEACKTEFAAADAADLRVTQLKDLEDQGLHAVKDATRHEEKLRKKLDGAEDRLKRARDLLESKRLTTREKLAELEARGRALQEFRTQVDDEMKEKQWSIDSVETKISGLKEDVNTEVDFVDTSFAPLHDHVQLYIKEMQQFMALNTFAKT